MANYTHENYTVKPLQRLLKHRADLLLEADRHRQIVKDLEAEEKELLAKTDMNDAEALKVITGVRLKRELAPKKVEEFERRAAELLDDIGTECSALCQGLEAVLNGKTQRVFAAIYEALRPFFVGRPQKLQDTAHAAFCMTNIAIQARWITDTMHTESFWTKAPMLKARDILAISEKVLRLEASGQPLVGLWTVKSADQVQDEELTRLLTDVGAAANVKRIMEAGGFTPERAAEITRGRTQYLLSEWAKTDDAKSEKAMSDEWREWHIHRATLVPEISNEAAAQSVQRRIEYLQGERTAKEDELARLLTADGREDFLKCVASEQGVTGDVAERCVDARIASLMEEVGRPAAAIEE